MCLMVLLPGLIEGTIAGPQENMCSFELFSIPACRIQISADLFEI
jgi:hypothetical protein